MPELNGKVALVTGSTRGVGYEIARLYLAEGMKVIINGRRTEVVNRTASKLNADYGASAVPIPADLSDHEEIEMLASQALALAGRVDVLVNNAGIGTYAVMPALEPAAAREMLEVNLYAPYLLTKLLLPQMLERSEGYIINIASLGARYTWPGGSVYCATKAGLLQFTNGLHTDLMGKGIKATCVLPGRIDTEFAGRRPGNPDALQARDVAKVCLDLLKDSGSALVSRIEVRPPKQ